jgi:hypothetical protein
MFNGDFVESTLWHTTPEMRNRKFMGYYRMSFEAFNSLVEELTSFLQSQCVNLVQPQVEIRKDVAIVIYRLAHGTSATHMADQFSVRVIKKYVKNNKKIYGHSVVMPYVIKTSCLASILIFHLVMVYKKLRLFP